MSQQARPAHMSEAQWQDSLESRRVLDAALSRGIGVVQTSAMRYAVIKTGGAAASQEMGSNFKYGYVNFQIVDGGSNLTWQQARALLLEIAKKQAAEPRYQPESKWWSR